MSHTDSHVVDVQPPEADRASTAALVLGLLSVPGSLLSWDRLPGGGFVWGFPVAIAAVVVGIHSARGAARKIYAAAGAVLGGAMVALMLAWTVVESW
jgi:hypothetical protein